MSPYEREGDIEHEGAERLADWEKQRLNQLFSRYPELKKAWVLKERFRAWYGQTDRKRAEQSLEAQGMVWTNRQEES